MSQNHAIFALTVIASAIVTALRFVGIDGAHAAAGATALGVARSDGAIGEALPVDVLGTAQVTAGAAIAKGAAIEVGADGKAITRSTGVTVARALEAAAADGDVIEVLLIAN